MMNKSLKTFFQKMMSSQVGLSYVEIILSLAVVGGTSLAVMKLSNTSGQQSNFIKQSFEIDSYMRGLSTHIQSLPNCQAVVPGGIPSSTDLTADLSSFSFDFNSGVTIEKTTLTKPSLSGANEVLPVELYVHFKRQVLGQDDSLKAVKRITFPGEFDTAGKFIGCSSYDNESQRAAYKLACEAIGGVFEDASLNSDANCSFASISEDSELMQNIRQNLCQNLLGGNLSGVDCQSMNLTTVPISGANISSSQFVIDGNAITTFTQTCGSDELLRGINSDGSIECIPYLYCSKCDGRCGAVDASVCGSTTSTGEVITDPCASLPVASTVCEGVDLVTGYPSCGQGTKTTGSCADPCEDIAVADYCLGESIVIAGQTCGEGTKTTGDCAVGTCWSSIKNESTMPSINPLWQNPGRFVCTGSSEPGSLSDTSGPCNVGDSCTYEAKYSSKQYICIEDNGSCVAGSEELPEPEEEKVYRVNCGDAVVRNGGESESGLRCGSPHGSSCTAAQVGQSFGTITCERVDEARGESESGDGELSSHSCSCVSCSDDATQQIFISSNGYSEYACEGSGTSTTGGSTTGGSSGCAGNLEECQCFTAGTLISMADGSFKNIEDVRVGDKVKGSDGINTVLELKPSTHSGFKYSINGSGYFVTQGHPFMTQDGWKAFNPEIAMEINPTLEIKKLQIGDVLIREEGRETIISIDLHQNDENIYNFELDGTKDYYADGYLVHNK